jgi:hypothetical protein
MTLTLRNLPREVEEAVLKRARERGTSATKAVLELLEEATGATRRGKRKQVHHDLDALFGSLSPREAAELEKSVAEQRTIDPDLWK